MINTFHLDYLGKPLATSLLIEFASLMTKLPAQLANK